MSEMIVPDICTQNEDTLPIALGEFIKRLKGHSGAKPLDLLVAELEILKPTRQLLDRWVNFDSQVYKRNVVYRDSDFEILVLNWMSGQRSPIHNHKNSACAVYVIEGIASEIVYERSSRGAIYPVATQHYYKGTTCGSFDEDIHQIVNLQPANKDLISMHIYSPPLHKMEVFSLSESIFAEYDQLMALSSPQCSSPKSIAA